MNDQGDAWDRLHRGTEREGIDSPSRFELNRVAALVNTRKPAASRPPAQPRSMVRPYARTGGRTRPDHDLALEALVSTSEHGRRYRGEATVQHRLIRNLCAETRSIAEIAAHLGLPLGVVKVLVGDMAEEGMVLIHQPGLVIGDRSSREFMERVLHGLRSL